MSPSTSCDLLAIAALNDEGLDMYEAGLLSEAQNVFIRVLHMLRTKLNENQDDDEDDNDLNRNIDSILSFSICPKRDDLNNGSLLFTGAIRLALDSNDDDVPILTTMTAVTLYNLALVCTLTGINRKRKESTLSRALKLYNQALTVLDCHDHQGLALSLMTAAIYTNMAYIQEDFFSNTMQSSCLIHCLEEVVLMMVQEYYNDDVFGIDALQLFFKVIYISSSTNSIHSAAA